MKACAAMIAGLAFRSSHPWSLPPTDIYLCVVETKDGAKIMGDRWKLPPPDIGRNLGKMNVMNGF